MKNFGFPLISVTYVIVQIFQGGSSNCSNTLKDNCNMNRCKVFCKGGSNEENLKSDPKLASKGNLFVSRSIQSLKFKVESVFL